ncbi:hypothetical protein [Vibrio neptunius]|uniref:Uncharacterized protein n=1 Tax=Vibrio neptunius TaxID=170651 RepID=A0ABS2ZZS0_9VIBR|nr:hypothetical protein [Vibrio neptunius]MBN3492464.1 hypothetical protein [Vibrio neptunius]MBN3514961.1 hypothetical protein [Vibrio neptunius]MBN3548779.1 hypothetical protein [Vibrio neptunius]MBN3573205.1 hypothetical protein [Vibrio neptunius]MBN3577089.1 hypothetical protein [Vibrio neptunius]
MKPLCPLCHTEMLERSNIHICPRNDIGDCSYDALGVGEEDPSAILNQERTMTELRSYTVSDYQ